MQESYRFVVKGRVQGVGFRISTQRKALFLGLRGWVRNRDDDAVEGCVGGRVAADVSVFRDWLQHGPAGARVEAVEWLAVPEPVDESSFVVRR
ncbi:MAG: acylphosphatase [Nevskia sp.]